MCTTVCLNLSVLPVRFCKLFTLPATVGMELLRIHTHVHTQLFLFSFQAVVCHCIVGGGYFICTRMLHIKKSSCDHLVSARANSINACALKLGLLVA